MITIIFFIDLVFVATPLHHSGYYVDPVPELTRFSSRISSQGVYYESSSHINFVSSQSIRKVINELQKNYS